MHDKIDIFFIDLETGGLDPEKCGICSLTVSKYGDDDVKTWYFQPIVGKLYEDEALEINKLSISFLIQKGMYEEDILSELKEYVSKKCKHREKKPYLAGHNIDAFDNVFLNIFYKNELFNYFNDYTFDTYILCKLLKAFNYIKDDQSLKLGNIYKFFYGEDDNSRSAHGSHYDVIMNKKLFDKLLAHKRIKIILNAKY